jgi:hypothetical protein
MTYELTDSQKSELRKLFNGTDELMDTLFWNIQYVMKESFLPPKGVRKSVIKEKITLLKEVTKASKELRLLLIRLDEYSLEQINMELGETVGKEYDGIGTSSICALKTIEECSAGTACFYEENYSETYAKWALDNLLGIWPYWFEKKVTLTEHSTFIKYLAIVLDEESTDKLVKQCKRSGLFETDI